MRYALALGVSFLLTLLLTRLIERLAPHWHLVDIPDERKTHGEVRPIGGGAIFLGTILSALPVLAISQETLSLLLGGFLALTVGLIDDLRGLSPKLKLIGQLASALVPVLLGGIVISSVNVGGLELVLGIGAVPFTLFWIVGAINALNLIDGLDGLATGGASIIALFVLLFAVQAGNTPVMLLASAILGGTLGFLRYNFHPARVFLGDGGSHFLGYMLSILTLGALQSDLGRLENVPILVPLLLLGLPIADTAWAILRRLKARRSIFQADLAHIHHRLLKCGLGYRRTVLILYAIFIGLGLLAWLMKALISAY